MESGVTSASRIKQLNDPSTGGQPKGCMRCGKCCMQSSPTFLKKDSDILPSKHIGFSHIYTIRKGELVNNNIQNMPEFTPVELIKIKEKNNIGGGCLFYDETEKSCSIYEKRPLQCIALECWDTDKLINLLKGPKPSREDIIRNNVLSGLIQEHENRCSYLLLREYVERIASDGEKAIKKILDILRFDHQIRPFVCEKLNLDMEEIDFYLGRPMTDTIKMFGLEVVRGT